MKHGFANFILNIKCVCGGGGVAICYDQNENISIYKYFLFATLILCTLLAF
jgi:hypothetical protein